MAEGQGNAPRGTSAGPQGLSSPVCPCCKHRVAFTSREEAELRAKRSLLQKCKGCPNYLRVVLTDDNRLYINLAGQPGSASPDAAASGSAPRATPPNPASGAAPPTKGSAGGSGQELSEDEIASMMAGGNKQPAGKAMEPKRPPAGNGPRAEPLPPPSPPPVSDRRLEAVSPLQQLDRAIKEATVTLAKVQGQVTSLQESVKRGLQVQLGPESWKLVQDMGTACEGLVKQFEEIAQRAENAAARTQQLLDEGTAETLAEHLLTRLLAPGRLWAGLNVYREWVLDQRCGEAEERLEERRLRIIEHLPGLFRIVEDALAEWAPADSPTPIPPERQKVLDELKKVWNRIRDWLGSAAGLVFFANPGEAFDIAQHELHSSVVANDPQQAGLIKEVIRTGYRLGSDGPILRKASVVCWVKPRGKAAQEHESQGS